MASTHLFGSPGELLSHSSMTVLPHIIDIKRCHWPPHLPPLSAPPNAPCRPFRLHAPPNLSLSLSLAANDAMARNDKAGGSGSNRWQQRCQRRLTVPQAAALAEFDILAPPDTWMPKWWLMRADGVPVLPPRTPVEEITATQRAKGQFGSSVF